MKPLTKSNVKTIVPVFRNFLDNFWGADRFFDDDFFNYRSHLMPAVNIKENKDNFEIEVAAPGMDKEDFNIEIENGMLCISAKKEESKEEKDENYTRKEFNYSSFERSFTLPENIDAESIEAKYVDGVLKLFLKKTEAVVTKPKKITIK